MEFKRIITGFCRGTSFGLAQGLLASFYPENFAEVIGSVEFFYGVGYIISKFNEFYRDSLSKVSFDTQAQLLETYCSTSWDLKVLQYSLDA